MDFAIPQEVVKDLEQFTGYLRTHLEPELAGWYKKEAIPREFFRILGKDGWLGFTLKNGEFLEQSYLKQTILLEHLAKISPGVAVAIMAHISLGMVPLYRQYRA
jgi:alkylation response protein AidB-like acyl-CoA dehydrogenase